MQTPGQHTLKEIYSQPAAWEETLRQLRGENSLLQTILSSGFDHLIFTGCGSTYYTALAAAAFVRALTGQPATAWPASELWLNPQASYPRAGQTLLVPFSRSGETSETVQACQAFHQSGRGKILTLSCYPDTPLANAGDWNLILPAGQEQSWAQTRAFTSLYLASIYIGCLLVNAADLLSALDRLPGLCAQFFARRAEPLERLGSDLNVDRVYFLGSGLLHGLACELSMKMKEMSLTHCEPFHFLEFRHGPKTMAGAGALVVGLVTESSATQERAVAADVLAIGGRSLLIGESEVGLDFQSGLPEILRGPLYLLPGQLLAYHRAIAKSLNPDRPSNLLPVVKLG